MYMYEQDLALNNLQWLVYHKTQLNQIWVIPLLRKETVLDIIIETSCPEVFQRKYTVTYLLLQYIS